MSKQSQEGLTPLTQTLLYPQESLAPVGKKHQRLSIGVPKENNPHETRVPLTPEAVAILVGNGHEVTVETHAGEGAKYDDRQFSEAGARISYSAEEVFGCDVVIKIDPPTEEELEWMKPGHMLISTLQMAKLEPNFIKALLRKKVIALAYEFLEDAAGGRPIVRTMSEIAGSTVMLIAAEYLSSMRDGKGIILGGITGVPPSRIVIIGAGTVGEYAARTAIGLGAEIKIFDRSLYRLRRLKYAIGQQIYTSTLNAITLAEAISRADVVIGALRSEGTRSPFVVTEEMVASMQPGSIIIDVSIDQGGCVETSEISTHKQPVYKKYGIIHYAVPNIAARVARTSSSALSNIFAPYLIEMGDCGGVEETIFTNKGFLKGVYAHKGSLTNAHIARSLGMSYKDLALLMAARL
ncbi:alanine dehydrogenase [Eisenibacter elegans]|jgi:alanine dehydrogenase|uniref:alanine dehydrogenase n=1 Tax=Eisenibacter elegans TaxID=997 RepID=UPI00040AED1A|nr:alanine dehydrogenase [Eisenibacter elegans]